MLKIFSSSFSSKLLSSDPPRLWKCSVAHGALAPFNPGRQQFHILNDWSSYWSQKKKVFLPPWRGKYTTTQQSVRGQKCLSVQKQTLTQMPCPFGSAGLISESVTSWFARSVSDGQIPLSATKENTCLNRPNPSLRPCSRGSCGPHLIRTRAPGQGQDRLDPLNPPNHPCTHTHTPPSLPPTTSIWTGPLILGLGGAPLHAHPPSPSAKT